MKNRSAAQGDRIRVPFRIALSMLLAILLLGTVAGIGILSYSNLRKNADDLSSQILDQTSRRIEMWVGNLLSRAHDQSQLNRSTLGQVRLSPKTFTWLGSYWRRVMESQPYFTFLSVRLETGGMLSIERLQDGELVFREVHLNRDNDTIEIIDYSAEDFRERKALNRKIVPRRTDRKPSWYLQARDAGRPVWTEARTIRKGVETVAGVTFVAPIFGAGREFRGVTSVDYDIVAVSKYLAANPVGKEGFAFIIEKPAKGEPRVIAHPTPELLTRTVMDERGRPGHEFIPFRSLSDARVARFMERFLEGSARHPGDGPTTFPFRAGGEDYFGSYRRMEGQDFPGWIIASVIPRKEIMGLVDRNNLQTLGIGLAGFFLILLASHWISGRIAEPLGKIASDQEAIGRFELETHPIERSVIKEVDQLIVATEDMKRGLRSFGKYVPADLVREILTSGEEAVLGGRRETLTVFFSDVREFTSIAERMPPEALVEQFGEYLGEMYRQIREECGTVDKQIGDSIMAFWGAPTPNPDHAAAACRAALLCQERLGVLREKWKREGKPLLHQRIGIDTGEVVVGNMGSESRMNYTVIGDHVNTASRLEGLNRHFGTQILIGPGTYDLVKDRFVARPLDLVSVKGRKGGIRVYELMGDRKISGEKQVRIAEWTTVALDAYLANRWDGAIENYEKVLLLDPGDPPAALMLARSRECVAS
jgi:adenylate cyclase